jgi:hypothetical protein
VSSTPHTAVCAPGAGASAPCGFPPQPVCKTHTTKTSKNPRVRAK